MTAHESVILIIETFGIQPYKVAEIIGKSKSTAYSKKNLTQGNKFTEENLKSFQDFFKENLKVVDLK